MKKDFLNSIAQGFLITILAAMAGYIAAYITGFIFLSIDFLSGERRNHGENSIDTGIKIFILLAAIIGSVVAGFIAAIISKRKPLLYASISGIALIIIWMVSNNFNFTGYMISEKISTYLILPFAILGGWLGFKRKTRKKKVS